MSILAPRFRASITRRSDWARAGPVFVPVWRRDSAALARPAAELCPELDQPARPEVVASLAARFAFPQVRHALSTIVDNQRANRQPRFPSFRNGRDRKADHKRLRKSRP